jgi:hypothetical protein
VIPVLVDGALMPRSSELPDDLKPLTRRNALEVSYNRFKADFGRLLTAIEKAFEKADAERKQRDEKKRLEIQFFSCFISYSTSDKDFAMRLHEALQSKGIRCWLDEKQLQPGDDISRELDRGIYLWDKFLLCASKNSLTSWWVQNEIKTTLEKERALRKERGKPVHKLIPLNLDGFMFTDDWDLGVLANEIRSRVAADFQGWETNKESFDAQVDLVIKALRADEGGREKPPPSRL